MLRNIYTVKATQVVTSAAHPEGLLSDIDGYPQHYDSRSYEANESNPNGNPEIALICAQADYSDRVKRLATAASPSRVMWTVTISQANGVQIARKSWGRMPDMTPAPGPEESEAE